MHIWRGHTQRLHICNPVGRCLVDLPLLLQSSKIRISPYEKRHIFHITPLKMNECPRKRHLCRRKCHLPSSIFNLSFRGSSFTQSHESKNTSFNLIVAFELPSTKQTQRWNVLLSNRKYIYNRVLHPRKLTWHWKIPVFNRKYIYKLNGWFSIVMLVSGGG